jgi:cell division protein FtsZ
VLASSGLEQGRALDQADTVLVSLVGGADLTMAKIKEVMELVNRRCQDAQMVMGTALEESWKQRLSISILASRREETAEESASEGMTSRFYGESPKKQRSAIENAMMLNEGGTRPPSRFVAPPPALTAEKREQLLAQQAGFSSRSRKAGQKPRQGQLPLEIVSKGRFEKSEPTIRDGEDLDIPTYIRRGVALN